jgi:hypothetical protein
MSLRQRLDRLLSHPVTGKLKRYWLTVAFLLGFVIDNLTLNRVDQVFDNIILLTYVILAAAALLILYAGTVGKLGERHSYTARKYAPLLVQYAFGGLLSGMLIFYGRSGAWVESWPFLAVILAAIYFNETITNRTERLIYNIAIFFIGLMSYAVLVIPVLTGWMGPWIFIASGLLALMLMYGYMQLLYRIIPHFIEMQLKVIVFSIGCVYVGFNFLYFTNIIPPIPLSLKDVGIYHSVIRLDGERYQLKYEEGKWWQFFRDSDTVFHPEPGGNVYCFAKVFAPTRIATEIVHNWEYQDPVSGEWESYARLPYPIQGGRDDGYRGYTLIRNWQDGKWRCSVETERGQVLGREVFTVDSSEPPAPLVTIFD